MAGGREFHDQPKRLAEVSLEMRGDLIVGTVTRHCRFNWHGTVPFPIHFANFVNCLSEL
jgi:acetoacetate decarboxylase